MLKRICLLIIILTLLAVINLSDKESRIWKKAFDKQHEANSRLVYNWVQKGYSSCIVFNDKISKYE